MTPAPTPVTPIATAIMKPRTISTWLFALDVYAALQLLAAPAARARIIRINGGRGARRATNAGVTLIVKRQHGDAAALQVRPHVGVGPIGQRAHFQQLMPGEMCIRDRGTVIEGEAHFDNSPNNRFNPDPTKEVHYGEQTWEEMMIGFFDVAVPMNTTALDLMFPKHPREQAQK